MAGDMESADAIDDDFDRFYDEDEVPWGDRVTRSNPEEPQVTEYLTDDEMYKKLGFQSDYDWSTTVVFKFDVACPDMMLELFRYAKRTGIEFGGWCRTVIRYVHLFKTTTVDQADELVARGDVVIEGVPCRILPLRTVDDIGAVRNAE